MRSQSPRGAMRCDGVNRRDFVRIGGLAALGLGAGELLTWRTAAARRAVAPAKRCILIWLDGGPSHLETFDLKPDAPSEVRGPFRPIATTVPGIAICEWLPGMAKRMKTWSIVRSVTSPLGEHNFGTHYLMTGYKPTPALEYPAVGCVVGHLRDAGNALPGHVAIPEFRVGGGRMSGQGFLPPSAKPFSVGSDPAARDFHVANLDYFPGIDQDRLERRRRFLQYLDTMERRVERGTAGLDVQMEQAYRLITSSDAKQAFRLEEEPPRVRERYGSRTIGQSCLLARRLIERNVPFVTVNHTGWDTHQDLYTRLKEGYTGAKVPVGLIPPLDMALAALIDDLQDRGLLDSTLVVVMGEFGRTPKLNTSGGRDHWPRVFSVAMAGGGVPGGQVIGASDSVGESPADRPVTPADLAATMYTLLGFDPRQELHTPDGRPIRLSRDGMPLPELVG